MHSHKLLCYIPFVTAVCYLDEMARVELTGQHFVPLSGGRTELLVFKRR